MLKSIFLKKSNFYFSKNEYYETLSTENNNLKILTNDLGTLSDLDSKTDLQIFYNNKLKLNSSYQEIIDCLGTPLFEKKKSLAQPYSVLFYKKKIGTFKVRLEIHVINGLFLIGFISFNLTNKKSKSYLIDIISNKYNIDHTNLHLSDFRIYNDENEFIKIIDSVDLTLAYGINSESNKQIIERITIEKKSKYLTVSEQNSLIVYNNI